MPRTARLNRRRHYSKAAGATYKGGNVAADQLFDRSGRHRLGPEAVAAVAARRLGGREKRLGWVVGDAGQSKPGG
jgi:hypothetical protein